VQRNAGGQLRIATGDGWLVPTRVQRAGGKALDVEAFLRGRPIDDGCVLGDGELPGEPS
jgi:methionyl-tRNA formyltransferase